MIPRRLRLRNFLSYRDCELDLTGLRLAVLCGPNGNGKSALLDAMTWALWGEGRGRIEDDRIHLGEQEMLVDFEFEATGDTFQVIRKRTRGRAAGSLGFLQVTPEGGRIPLTGGTIADTQAEIVRKIRMDYDTFVNSAFIAQGRANEFTKKRPADRKEVFRNVLGLQRYQDLADAAGERRKDASAALKELERNIGDAADEIRELPAVEATILSLEFEREALEPRLQTLQDEVVQLMQTVADHARLEREAVEALEGTEGLRSSVSRLEGEVSALECELRAANESLARGDEVRSAHARLQELREREHGFAAVQQEARSFEASISEAEREVSMERSRIEAELANATRAVDVAQAVASTVAALEREQVPLQQDRDELARLAKQSEELESEGAALRTEGARAGDRANLAATRNKELKEREGQLESAEAACPVCLKALAPGDRDHMRAEYAREREALRLDYETARAAKARALDGADQATAKATAIRDDARRRDLALRERERDLDARLPAAREAHSALPALRQAIAELERTLSAETFAASPRTSLAVARAALVELGYDGVEHAEIRTAIARLGGADAAFQALLVAAERSTATEARIVRERQELDRCHCELVKAEARLVEARDALALAEDVQPRLDAAQDALNGVRRRESELAMQLGKAQARQEALRLLDARVAMAQDEMSRHKEEEGVYGELAAAFGRNGIQAMLIDQSLPRVEHTANEMLDRMTGGRIHVNLATQRQNAAGRITETLDIRISDEIGTRAYEMYSGGEAFRVDFALRIALARLLAERAGATLPTLIIDEGFGSQDAEGIEGLVQAITTIQDEFRLILVVTHIDDLKERFERRIEVTKDHRRGSLARVV